MKTFYLSKNRITGEHNLDDGALGSRRECLGKDEDYLINYLKDKIDKKRKAELYIAKREFSFEQVKDICKLFSDSKIRIYIKAESKM